MISFSYINAKLLDKMNILRCFFAVLWVLSFNLAHGQSVTLTERLAIDEPSTFFQDHAGVLGLGAKDEMRFVKSIDGANHHEHHRYVPYHNGHRVFGGDVTVHALNGESHSVTGNIKKSFSSLRNRAFSENQLIWRAKQHAARIQPENKNLILTGDLEIVTEWVWIDPSYPKNTESAVLALNVQLKDLKNDLNLNVLMDGQEGDMVYHYTNIMHKGVPGTGMTKYLGEKEFICDSVGPNEYHLFDETRGDGVLTLDGLNQVWKNTSTHWDFTNTENEVAVDLHYGMTEFYDLMASRFDWKGIDNEDGQLISVVSDEKFINAFWNGEFATFGRGDCNHGPLTTLEVIAHELMHGVTDYTSDLIYSSESGAINESMSDVFGKALEYYVDPAGFDWLIGQSFLLNQYGRHFRSMEDPNTRNHPKYYGGQFWNDNGGVHTNSSIGNHWFYRLVEGGKGTNEAGYAYDFEGIGMDRALQIVFLTQRAYLFSSSDYQFYYETSLQAAEEIFGAGSEEVDAVKEAWAIVGLPSTRTSTFDYDLSLSWRFEEDMVCLDNEFLKVIITVKNTGLQDYNSSVQSAEVLSDGTKVVDVQGVIPSGEEREYVIDDFYFVDFFGNEFSMLELRYALDQNSGNNRDWNFITNGNPQGLDIQIFAGFVDDIVSCGENQMVPVQFFNFSCFATTGNDQAELVFRTDFGQEVGREQITIPPLEPGQNALQWFEYNINSGANTYEVTLEASVDVNPDNNSFVHFPQRVEEVTGAFFENFDNNQFPSIMGTINFFANQLYDLQGDFHFAATGDFPIAIAEPCSTPEDAANSDSRGSLFMCVDLFGMEKPTLGFSVTQYRNPDATNFPELRDNTSVLMVRTINGMGQVREEYYSGLEEGQEESFELRLDPNFTGSIEFVFSCKTGVNPLDPSFLEYDVILLDDIYVENQTSVDHTSARNLIVQPNPSHSLFQITSDVEIESYRVHSIDGRLVQKDHGRNTTQFDLSKEQNGVYILEVTLKDGTTLQQRLIKN